LNYRKREPLENLCEISGERAKKLLALFEKRVILSAGAMLIFSVSFQIDQMDRSPTGNLTKEIYNPTILDGHVTQNLTA
jgi:hypothetical protein